MSSEHKWLRFTLAAVVASMLTLAHGECGLAQVPDFSNPPPPRQPRTQPKSQQPAGQSKPAAKQRRPNRSQAKVPAPENVTLTTKDGVELTCTWFGQRVADPKLPPQRNTVDGKNVVPFILLHDWDRSRRDLLLLGRYLQLNGHAAIVPDFRGHGESLKVAGSEKPLDRTKFRKRDIASLLGDIEACKKHLMRKNDAGEVNIDLLNVVAVGGTSVLAMEWAISDWSWAPVGSVKQGQDVKSLILIAPQQKLKAASMKRSLKHPLFVGREADPLPLLIVYSAQHSESSDSATEIFAAIEKGRKKYMKIRPDFTVERPTDDEPQVAGEPDAEAAGEAKRDEPAPLPPPISPMKTLVSGPVPGATQPGSEMISSPQSQGVFGFINKFVNQAVLSRRQAYRWQERLK